MKTKSKKQKGQLNTSTIKRIDIKEGNYAYISRNAMLDTQLSDSALRLLLCILNNSNTFVLNLTYYQKLFGWGSGKLKRVSNELYEQGYFKSTKNSLGAKGFSYHYDIWESPNKLNNTVPSISVDTVPHLTESKLNNNNLNKNNVNNINTKEINNKNDVGDWCISNTREEENLEHEMFESRETNQIEEGELLTFSGEEFSDVYTEAYIEEAPAPTSFNKSIEGNAFLCDLRGSNQKTNILPSIQEKVAENKQKAFKGEASTPTSFIKSIEGEESVLSDLTNSTQKANIGEASTPTSFINKSTEGEEAVLRSLVNSTPKVDISPSVQEKVADYETKECPVTDLNNKEIFTKEEEYRVIYFILFQFKKKEKNFRNKEEMRLEAFGFVKWLERNGFRNFKDEIVDNWFYFATNVVKSIISEKRTFKSHNKKVKAPESHSIHKSNSAKPVQSTDGYQYLLNYISEELKTHSQKQAFELLGGIGTVIGPIIAEFGMDDAIRLIIKTCETNNNVMPDTLREAAKEKSAEQFKSSESLGLRKYGVPARTNKQ